MGQEVGENIGLQRQEGWSRQGYWILDLSRPGPGGKFTMGHSPEGADQMLARLPVEF